MNTENAPETEWMGIKWTAAEENVLVLARELEWAEAYAADHPKCGMGRLYLDFLHWEMVTAQSAL